MIRCFKVPSEVKQSSIVQVRWVDVFNMGCVSMSVYGETKQGCENMRS